MGVMAVVADRTDMRRYQATWTATRVATFFDVGPTLIEGVLYIGPSRLLFYNGDNGYEFRSPSLKPFLKDSSRSGEFFICDRSLDLHFSRILSSLRTLSGGSTYSRDILNEVLAITLVLTEGMGTVLTNAAALDIDPSHVQNIVQLGISKQLFQIRRGAHEFYSFSTASIVPFLRDAERSGDFYISDATIDALFIRILSLPSPSHLSDPPS